MMQVEENVHSMNLVVGRLQRDLLITAPDFFKGHLKLTVPEFYGRTNEEPFAIDQVLTWQDDATPDKKTFILDTPAAEIGIDYRGRAALVAPDEVEFVASVRNGQQVDIVAAHHTLHLDTTTIPEFDDPDGSRTYVYTSEGWATPADLLGSRLPRVPLLRVGAALGHVTIIWKMVARADESGTRFLAFALDRGYAFASNHPDWPPGLLAGCRWGTLEPNEEQVVRAKLYLSRAGLDDLRGRYARDFR